MSNQYCKAPLDQPYVCRKGHVTEAGWVGQHKARCRECQRKGLRSRFKKYYLANRDKELAKARAIYRANREAKLRYYANRKRTWGRQVQAECDKRYRERHRERIAAVKKARILRLRQNGFRLYRGVIVGPTPTQLALLRATGERPPRVAPAKEE